ncbi:S8 family serine peptidase [Bremerella sp. JC770]|uniref:S8 family serine peptidase n=1 Tax=Bremerella sp. JC770 TaxID=3232137 RepID=UPI00345912AC
MLTVWKVKGQVKVNTLSCTLKMLPVMLSCIMGLEVGRSYGQDDLKRPYTTGDIDLAPTVYDKGQVAAEARFLHRVDELRKLVEPELSGDGVTVGVWDEGLILEHSDLKGRVSHAEKVWKKLSDHATHVGGTIAGNGLGKEAARGMASRAQLLSYSFQSGNDLEEMEGASGVRISNHSYGRVAGWYNVIDDSDTQKKLAWVWAGEDTVGEDPIFGQYTITSARYDAFAHKRPEWTVVAAAGNSRNILLDPRRAHHLLSRSGNDWLISYDLSFDGSHVVFKPGVGLQRSSVDHPSQTQFDTIPGGIATAKNVITVGNMADPPIENIGQPLTPDSIKAHQSSSMGPTDDGRIKPDVIANGDVLLATTLPEGCKECVKENVQNDKAYGKKTGTSMAAPVVSGILALLNELSKRERNLPLRSDESKAILVHTAISPGDKPRYDIGWGAVDAKSAGALVIPDYGFGQCLTRISATKTEPYEIELERAPLLQIRITLAWLDQAGEPRAGLNSRDTKLVDDLDMRLISPSGVEFRPWVLDPDSPEAEAQRGDNVRDNLERIDIKGTEADEDGVWKLQVCLKQESKSREVAAALCIRGFEIDGTN